MEQITRSDPACRLCKKIFKVTTTSKQSRINIFKRNTKGVSLQSRFEKFDIFLRKETGLSDAICRPCENKLQTLEKAEAIKLEWGIPTYITTPTTTRECIPDPLNADNSDLSEKQVRFLHIL